MTWLSAAGRRLDRQLRRSGSDRCRCAPSDRARQILRVADHVDGRGLADSASDEAEIVIGTPSARRRRARTSETPRRKPRCDKDSAADCVNTNLPARRSSRRVEAGDRIAQRDLDGLHDAAGRVLHGALHGASAAQPLGVPGRHADRREARRIAGHGNCDDRMHWRKGRRREGHHVPHLSSAATRNERARWRLVDRARRLSLVLPRLVRKRRRTS